MFPRHCHRKMFPILTDRPTGKHPLPARRGNIRHSEIGFQRNVSPSGRSGAPISPPAVTATGKHLKKKNMLPHTLDSHSRGLLNSPSVTATGKHLGGKTCSPHFRVTRSNGETFSWPWPEPLGHHSDGETLCGDVVSEIARCFPVRPMGSTGKHSCACPIDGETFLRWSAP